MGRVGIWPTSSETATEQTPLSLTPPQFRREEERLGEAPKLAGLWPLWTGARIPRSKKQAREKKSFLWGPLAILPHSGDMGGLRSHCPRVTLLSPVYEFLKYVSPAHVVETGLLYGQVWVATYLSSGRGPFTPPQVSSEPHPDLGLCGQGGQEGC